jgi:RNase P subunit RPR2
MMPTFDSVSVEVDVIFEVFCGRCNAGLCNQSETRRSRGRGEQQVLVEPCENCIEEAREEIRRDLEDQIQELQDQLTRLGHSDD